MSDSVESAETASVNTQAAREYARRYRSQLLESVIPFWEHHSLDREYGGYFSCLDRTGSIYDSRKYIWMQGRQVWMFSRLYRELAARPEWLEIARGGVGFLRRFAKDPKGRCYFALTREGKPVAYQRKPYAAVFTMLGLLEYGRAAGDEECVAEALEWFHKIELWNRDPRRMGRPHFAGQALTNHLADVMVRLCMALELDSFEPDPHYAVVVEDCLRLAALHYDPERRIFKEHAWLAGGPPSDVPEARLWCPGHSIEVAWFILHAVQRFPETAWQQRALGALLGSIEGGWDHEYGGLFYFADVLGRPLPQLEAPMKLWWPHAEMIYALALAWSMTGEQAWMTWLSRADEYVQRQFSDPEYGEWFGYCDRRGNRVNEMKGGAYKGCFHVPRALLLASKQLEDRTIKHAV